ncbi:MAG: SRPBCC family protein [Silanimonas sp.]
MDLQGDQLIRAPRARVWAALNDPDMLTRCIPGCEEVRRVGDAELETRMLAKIGPVRARFGGRIRMSDIVAEQGCSMAFEGDGGAAGMAKGASQVRLSDEGADTRLHYTVQAAVGGKLGQIGGRLIDASAKKLAGEFFEALNEQLAPAAPAAQAVGEPAGQALRGTAAPGLRPAAAALLPGAGWAGELQRLAWLAVGVAIGLVLGRLLPF